MSAIRVMLVDDSPFSRTMLAQVLQERGCEIVGEAESIESLVKTYTECKPDIVTMDLVMPGADGFECSKALLVQDPGAKIIIVSSMMDDDTEAEARRVGVVGYVQKPADIDNLMQVINNALSPDELFQTLVTLGSDIFKESLAQNITRMTKEPVEFTDKDLSKQVKSRGITVVIGIIGRYPGTMILDFSLETANTMTERLLRRPARNQEEATTMAAEFANVVSGMATSMLNKKEKALKLRVAPPSVFFGAPTEIASPNIKMRGFTASSKFGDIDLSIGFKKGSVLWM